MNKGMSFCQRANQSLSFPGTVAEKEKQDDPELRQVIALLKEVGLLGRYVYFDKRVDLGRFLIYKNERFRNGERLNENQRAVLDQALHVILGRGLYV